MKTPEEIKEDAATCLTKPPNAMCDRFDLNKKCKGDCSYVIKELYGLVLHYESRLAQVERERDAAVADLKDCADGHCIHCKSINLATECDFNGECYVCLNDDCPCHESNCQWQWRGVCEENTHDQH